MCQRRILYCGGKGEGQTLPADAGLDVRVSEVSLVEEVGDSDSDGVGGPLREAKIVFVGVED